MSKIVEIAYTMRGTLVLEVPNDFVTKRIDQNYIAKEMGITEDNHQFSIDFRITADK
jgi:hypothetical protein